MDENKTSHPLILAIDLARMINEKSGGAVIAPWEVDQLGEDEIEVFRALSLELPAMQELEQKKEQVFAEIRNNHPNYRKY